MLENGKDRAGGTEGQGLGIGGKACMRNIQSVVFNMLSGFPIRKLKLRQP